MTTIIQRSITEPIRKDLSWDERWKGPDRGLICCWEVGRKLRKENPELAQQALSGELVSLGWKGGVTSRIKGEKAGALYYLATWQGIRGEDLNIDLEGEYVKVCSRTGQPVRYRKSSGDAGE